jgi:PDZ domain-containing protein
VSTIKRVPEQPAGTDLPARAQVAQGEDLGRLTRGNKAVLAAFFLFLVVVVLGSVVHLPYAVMSPGPTQNTLGAAANGKGTPIIAISGLPTYPTDGALRFTTVRVEGGPGYPVNAWDILRAWVDPAQEVLPVDQVFDPQVTQQQVAEENAVQMEGSQEEATAVALRAIGKTVPTHIAIVGLTPTSKAKGLLEAGDRLDTIDGQPLPTTQAVRDVLQKKKPGETVSITVTRKGRAQTVVVPTVAGQGGKTALGVLLGLRHDFPGKITIDAGAIGGPSAGLMFSLGIYDKLTPGPLAGGRQIAGTGTIDDQGQVGPIGGIRQKLAGARADGAQYFLAPADNCDEVVGHVPDGLDVFKVGTFTEARTAVEQIVKGQTASLPRC